MREVKYKAWDKEDHEWLDIESFGFIDNKLWYVITHDGEKYYIENGYVEVVQYTGLKDKNDVEVYEGDILENENGLFKGVVKFGQYEEYSDGGYGEYTGFYLDMVDEGPSGGFQFYLDALDSTVIGNIYENPELLKEAD